MTLTFCWKLAKVKVDTDPYPYDMKWKDVESWPKNSISYKHLDFSRFELDLWPMTLTFCWKLAKVKVDTDPYPY